jgi:4-amino-4-deoxy-L-arabinose transferase-like glycosyltransferase
MTLHRYAFSFLVFITFAIYGVFLARHVEGYAGGSDSSGYMNNARLLEQGQLRIDRREIEGLSAEILPSYAYIPLGFIPVGTREMVPTYSMGLPLLILGMSHLTGWEHAADATQWLHAMLSLVVLYCLSIAVGLSHPLAWLGTLLLGLSSIFIHMALESMSDVPALAWCSFAVLAAWLSRRDARWALVAGLAFSVAVLMRPSNLLMIFPVAAAFGLGWRNWLGFIAGGVPGAIFLGAINLQLYGKAVTTGYGDVGSMFRLEYVLPTVRAYAKWLPVMLTPAVILLGAIPWMLYRRGDRGLVLLSVWAMVMPCFYATYAITHESWPSIRFLLPSFSAIIVLMLLAMKSIFSGFSARLRFSLGVLFAVFVLGWNVWWLGSLGQPPKIGDSQYAKAALWANENLPENAVILTMQTSGALLYYTKFKFLRYEQLDQDTFAKVERACLVADRPIYAMLFPFEIEEVMTKRMPGEWTKIFAFPEISIWRRTTS